jgi:hypothetical protein
VGGKREKAAALVRPSIHRARLERDQNVLRSNDLKVAHF